MHHPFQRTHSARHRTRAVYRGSDREQGSFILAGFLGRTSLLLAAIASPWMLGSVHAASQVYLFVTVFAAAICAWVLQTRSLGDSACVPASLLPLGCALALAAAQLVPIPDSLLRLASPAGSLLWQQSVPSEYLASPAPENLHELVAAEQRASAALGVPPAAGADPVSLYPHATRRQLGLLLVLVGAFFASSRLFRSPFEIRCLLGVIAFNGLALAIFGIVQQASWNGRIFWHIPLTDGGTPFASFINRNNAAGYLNLTLGAGLGVLGWWKLASRPRTRFSAPSVLWLILGGVCSVGILAGILCSLSRGAWIATIGGLAVVALAARFAMGRRLSIKWLVVPVGISVVLLVALGLWPAVQARLSTLTHPSRADANERLQHWRDMLPAAADYWRLGSGLGTYSYLGLLYRHPGEDGWYVHAENQYLETMVEAGVPGLLVLFGALAATSCASWFLLTKARGATRRALGLVCIFLLVSQSLHANFDFGLYIPANAIVMAILCGTVAGCAARFQLRVRRQRRQRRHRTWATTPDWPLVLAPGRALATSFAVILCMGIGWASVDVRRAVAAEHIQRAAHTLEVRSSRPLSEPLVSAAFLESGMADVHNAELHWELAKVWILQYRQQVYEAAVTGSSQPNRAAVWQQTDLPSLHANAQTLARNHRLAELASMRSDPLVQANLVPAARHLLSASRATPLLPKVHATLAQLWLVATSHPDNRLPVARGRFIARNDPEMLFRFGVLDWIAGRSEVAVRSWRNSLKLSPVALTPLLNLTESGLVPPAAVVQSLPDSPEMLLQFAKADSHRDTAAARLARDRAEVLIALIPLPDARFHWLQGELSLLRGASAPALKHWKIATDLQPHAAEWRYEFARLLRDQGRQQEAQEQAQTCVGMDPVNAKYRELLAELAVPQR